MFKGLKNKISGFHPNFSRIWPYFLFLFLVNVLIFNWVSIAWFFDYHFWADVFSASLAKVDPENLLPFLKENPLLPEVMASGQAGAFASPSQEYLLKEHFLTIPKLNIKAPLFFTTSTNDADFKEILKKGVLHYPASALPGEKGVTVILGHSASLKRPKINFDWVFSELEQLESGDAVQIDFNGNSFSFRVNRKFFLKQGEKLPADLTTDKSVVILMSCWPPGSAKKRLAVEALLQ